ncbi:hypothetical protein [Mycoplasmopsis gallinacea]|uniref:Uncharacterized protein n=1 Tax=Mycoplasmopsis gallinacea TaxID=29556 RepID=A0A6H0V210_9BACT|nr:hypothetical protein [Mycoplasmopsis gallinacea]QIW62371.1 hypothetical protein GOQ20_02970 [Mycoplasmopsis gallinacea]
MKKTKKILLNGLGAVAIMAVPVSIFGFSAATKPSIQAILNDLLQNMDLRESAMNSLKHNWR